MHVGGRVVAERLRLDPTLYPCSGPLVEEEERLYKLRLEKETEARERLLAEREIFEQEAKASQVRAEQRNTLLRTACNTRPLCRRCSQPPIKPLLSRRRASCAPLRLAWMWWASRS